MDEFVGTEGKANNTLKSSFQVLRAIRVQWIWKEIVIFKINYSVLYCISPNFTDDDDF